MNLREKKTRRNIRNAFLQLRAHKPLERITIKELSELAEISKGTFYCHYKDIFDLSSQLQHELLQDILDSIIRPDFPLFNMSQLTRELSAAFHARQSLIDILFSGDQAAVLPINIEHGIREYAFQIDPETRENAKFNVLLSFQVHGCYNAYQENCGKFGPDKVVAVLETITAQIQKEISFSGESLAKTDWKGKKDI